MPPTYVNGHISATGDPIHFMFGSRVGFSGTADRTALCTVRTNPRWRPPPCWKNFKWQYLRRPQLIVRSTSCFVLGRVFGDGESNGAISGSNKFKMAAASWIISNGHISTTAHDLLYRAHRAVIFAIAQLSC